MRIVYHLGAHCTDEDRLVRCLLKNRALLADQGIVVPSPTRYRRLLRDTAVQLRGHFASPETTEMVLDEIMDEADADRLILSWDGFMSFPAFALQGGLYASAGERVRAFTRIFPDIEAEYFLAIRNPATFLPALQEKVNSKGRGEILERCDIFALRWSEAVLSLRANCPGVPITVWCDEETPLIWPEVLQAVSDHDPASQLEDADELLAMIMGDIGLLRFKAYCQEHPPQSVQQRRRIESAFLEKFAKPDRVMQEIDLPDWTDETIERLTETYLQDVERIRAMASVRLIEA